MNLYNLIDVEVVEGADGEVDQIKDILVVADVIEEIQATDVMFKLSYVGGDILAKMAAKINTLRDLEIDKEKMDDYFTEDEKSFIYGCFLIGVIPESVLKELEKKEQNTSKVDYPAGLGDK